MLLRNSVNWPLKVGGTVADNRRRGSQAAADEGLSDQTVLQDACAIRIKDLKGTLDVPQLLAAVRTRAETQALFPAGPRASFQGDGWDHRW